ncbi:hypothetical protein EFA46_009175 [Halarchaeum sp. CBA1220]|uniref:hypothetical protein n=1 Tax=Halarchaeum sp. CBA1220 TaxID=1853682 RepID=UPI000F3A8154|nr:hypothetical protein [Halarchaeum sp. CBA1220]QLC34371.1 hypothetical protein EFA46_009175 [Halarchaeum sp. CBA1220]
MQRHQWALLVAVALVGVSVAFFALGVGSLGDRSTPSETHAFTDAMNESHCSDVVAYEALSERQRSVVARAVENGTLPENRSAYDFWDDCVRYENRTYVVVRAVA